MNIRVGNHQVCEEDAGHGGVVVLACVDDDVLMLRRSERIRNRGKLDELWTCSDDAEHLHCAVRSGEALLTCALACGRARGGTLAAVVFRSEPEVFVRVTV